MNADFYAAEIQRMADDMKRKREKEKEEEEEEEEDEFANLCGAGACGLLTDPPAYPVVSASPGQSPPSPTPTPPKEKKRKRAFVSRGH